MPEEPVMLLSYVNMKLRDFYRDLDSMCEDLDVRKQDITDKLSKIDYYYDREKNRFV